MLPTETDTGTHPDDVSPSLLAEYHQALLDGDFAPERLQGGADLAAGIRARGILEQLESLRRMLPTGSAKSPAAAIGTAEEAPVEPPLQFGRFTNVRVVGSGSQGLVFRAYDPVLRRELALKIPKPETLWSPEHQARFERESQAMARLAHPNIVSVHEVGQVGAVVYIASQFCAGPTLAEWQQSLSSPVNVHLATELIAVLADAVDYVHQQGILHRDIKPGNILLEPAPAPPSRPISLSTLPFPFLPKLADFGLARLCDATATATQSGLTAGTPAYMSPEQAAGHQDEIDERTDVYSLGAVLYELLTGQPPFAGRSALDVFRRMSQLSLKSPRCLRREVPRDLAAICLKCLEPDKRQRYATAAALAADLRCFQNGRPVLARPIGVVGATWKRCRRQPVLAAMCLALAVSLVGGMSAATWQWRQAEASRRLAEANYQQARRAVASFFEKLNRHDVFDDPAVQTARLEMLSVAQQYYEEFARDHGSDQELELHLAEATYRTAFIVNTIGSRGEALRLYEKSLPMWRRLVARNPELSEPRYFQIKTHTHIGQLHELFGRLDDASAAHHQALWLGEQLVVRHPGEIMFQDNLANSCRLIGLLHKRKREFDQAHAMLERARAILAMLAEKFPDNWELRRALGSVHNNIGSVFQAQQSLEQAFVHLRQSQLILEALVEKKQGLPWSPSDLAQTYLRLGELYFLSHNFPAAREHYQKAHHLHEEIAIAFPQVTSAQRELADSHMRLAKVARAERRWEQALVDYERALQIRKQLADSQPGPSIYHRGLAETLVRLADAHFYNGDLEKAQHWFVESQSIYRWLDEMDFQLPSRADLAFIEGGLHRVQQARAARRATAADTTVH